MLSYQSLMPAGAGTPRCENEAWSLEVFGCGWCHPSPLDSGLRRNDEFGGWNHSFSYQDWRRSCLPPTPLDSRFRGNDEWGAIRESPIRPGWPSMDGKLAFFFPNLGLYAIFLLLIARRWF